MMGWDSGWDVVDGRHVCPGCARPGLGAQGEGRGRDCVRGLGCCLESGPGTVRLFRASLLPLAFNQGRAGGGVATHSEKQSHSEGQCR